MTHDREARPRSSPSLCYTLASLGKQTTRRRTQHLWSVLVRPLTSGENRARSNLLDWQGLEGTSTRDTFRPPFEVRFKGKKGLTPQQLSEFPGGANRFPRRTPEEFPASAISDFAECLGREPSEPTRRLRCGSETACRVRGPLAGLELSGSAGLQDLVRLPPAQVSERVDGRQVLGARASLAFLPVGGHVRCLIHRCEGTCVALR